MTDFDRVEPTSGVAREHAPAHETETQTAADVTETRSAPGLLQLQRLAGNRAVRSMLPGSRRQPLGSDEEIARRQPLGADEEVARADEAASGELEEPARATLPDGRVRSRDVSGWAAAGAANPFDLSRGLSLAVQRTKTTAGYKKTAVAIESSAFTATAISPLLITKSATNLGIGSGPNPAYTAKGTVKIDGDPAEVGQYEAGFLQTVFESNRDFYYSSAKETSGHGAKKMTDYTKTQPGRDGDTGFVPWYGAETVVPFAAAASDTQSTRMDDTPSSGNVWVKDFGKGNQQLVKTGGRDTFASWLAVRNKRTKAVTLLNNASWNVDYGADVAVDTGNPANSKVTPSGQVSVTGTGDGGGGKTPIYTDPVANDAAWKTVAW